jgi:hypothetical protein
VRSTLTELCASRGISRTLLNRAIETGALPSELFPLRGLHRTVIDYERAGKALDKLLADPKSQPQLKGAAKPPPQSFAQLGIDLADERTWPADGPVLDAIKAFFAARRSKRDADELAEKYVSAARMRDVTGKERERVYECVRRIPETCAAALANKLGVTLEAAREACAPMAEAVERIIADHNRALESCLGPAREGRS